MLKNTDPTLPLCYPFPLGDYGTPPELIHWARENVPVCPVSMPEGQKMWMITAKNDIKSIMNDKRFSRNLTQPGAPRQSDEDFTSIPAGIFNMDPPDHNRVRRIIAPYYSAHNVERYRPMIKKHVDNTLRDMADGPNPTDLMAAMARPLSLLVGMDTLNLSPQLRASPYACYHTQTAVGASPESIALSTNKIRNFSQAIIDDKREYPTDDDPIGALIIAQREGTITEAELLGTVCFILITCVEPMVGPLGMGPFTLMRHPRQLQACLEHPQYWPLAVEEILRYHHNGVLGLPRMALEDVVFHGVTIKRGDGVVMPMLGATWDPKHYPQPERFDIHRQTNASITFGHGPHFCLGASLVRLFLHIAYAGLFTKFPTLKLAVPDDEVPWEKGMIFTGPASLPVIW